jgi:hypothetical protein
MTLFLRVVNTQPTTSGKHQPDHTGKHQPDHTGKHQPDHTGKHQPDHTGKHRPAIDILTILYVIMAKNSTTMLFKIS